MDIDLYQQYTQSLLEVEENIQNLRNLSPPKPQNEVLPIPSHTASLGHSSHNPTYMHSLPSFPLDLANTPSARQATLAATTIKGCDVQNYATEVDDCETMAAHAQLTLAEFITYNPSVGLNCSGLKDAQPYCVHVPDASKPITMLKPAKPAGVKAPGKTFGASASCKQWQKIFDGDVADKKETCRFVAVTWGSLMEIDAAAARTWLHTLNPGLKEDCSNIEVNSYLCVRVPLQTTL